MTPQQQTIQVTAILFFALFALGCQNGRRGLSTSGSDSPNFNGSGSDANGQSGSSDFFGGSSTGSNNGNQSGGGYFGSLGGNNGGGPGGGSQGGSSNQGSGSGSSVPVNLATTINRNLTNIENGANSQMVQMLVEIAKAVDTLGDSYNKFQADNKRFQDLNKLSNLCYCVQMFCWNGGDGPGDPGAERCGRVGQYIPAVATCSGEDDNVRVRLYHCSLGY